MNLTIFPAFCWTFPVHKVSQMLIFYCNHYHSVPFIWSVVYMCPPLIGGNISTIFLMIMHRSSNLFVYCLRLFNFPCEHPFLLCSPRHSKILCLEYLSHYSFNKSSRTTGYIWIFFIVTTLIPARITPSVWYCICNNFSIIHISIYMGLYHFRICIPCHLHRLCTFIAFS